MTGQGRPPLTATEKATRAVVVADDLLVIARNLDDLLDLYPPEDGHEVRAWLVMFKAQAEIVARKA